MPLSDYIDEQNSSKENSDSSGFSQVAADIWAASSAAVNKAWNFVSEHPLETAGTVAVAAGAAYLMRGRIASLLRPAALESEALLGTEALLSRGLPIDPAIRGAMMTPEIAALTPGARGAAVREIVPTNSVFGRWWNPYADHGPYVVPAIRDVGTATEALVKSGVPINASTRAAAQNFVNLRPASQLAAIRDLGLGLK